MNLEIIDEYTGPMLSSPQKVRIHHDHAFVADLGGHRVSVFDLDANYVDQIGTGLIPSAADLAIRDDRLLVSGTGYNIYEFDVSSSAFVSVTPVPSLNMRGMDIRPASMGETVIADSGSHLLISLDTANSFVGTTGTSVAPVISNPGPRDFAQCQDVLIVDDPDYGEMMMVADHQNRRIVAVVLDPKVAMVKMDPVDFDAATITYDGPSNFRPTAIAYNRKTRTIFAVDGAGGDVWFVDMASGSIAVGYNAFQIGAGQLSNPVGIAATDDVLAITDYGTNKIQTLKIDS
ncbi:MAG: hypothetical protein AAF467_23605 [Actinomycetota bacterium]